MFQSTTTDPSNPIKFYCYTSPNSTKPLILLEELSVKYEPIFVDARNGAPHYEPWFIEISPNSRLPAMTVGSQRVFESTAIMLYLIENYDAEKKFVPERNSPEYWEMMGWLSWQTSFLGPEGGHLAHYLRDQQVNEAAVTRFLKENLRLFDVLNSRLSQVEWLAGNKYTIADMACFAMIARMKPMYGLDVEKWPGTARWFKKIAERPAVVKARATPFPIPEEMFAEVTKSWRARCIEFQNKLKQES